MSQPIALSVVWIICYKNKPFSVQRSFTVPSETVSVVPGGTKGQRRKMRGTKAALPCPNAFSYKQPSTATDKRSLPKEESPTRPS